jgi:hypothetical protein
VSERARDHGGGRRPGIASKPGLALKALYWIAVLAISLLLLVGLISFLTSRDAASLKTPKAPASGRSR